MNTIADLALRAIKCEFCILNNSLCKRHKTIAESFGPSIVEKVQSMMIELNEIRQRYSLHEEDDV